MPTSTTFTVFDTETTGFDPLKGDRIIEIAGIRIENGIIQEEKTFVALVNPERAIPWESKQVHHIGDEDVKDAPTIDQVLPAFLEFAADSILVAHNAKFDMNFLQSEKESCWGYIDLPECICTMQLSKHVFPMEFRHNLNIVSTRLGLEIPTMRHRALPDVLLTAQALLAMIDKAKFKNIQDLKKVASISVTQMA